MGKGRTVGVDARTMYSPLRRGTGKSLLDLYRHLASLSPDWQFVMYHRQERSESLFQDLPNVHERYIEMHGDRWNLWQQVRLPLASWRNNVHLLHCPANTAPRFTGTPIVVTIHDLIPLEPEFRTAEATSWAKKVVMAARKARRIITPSEFTKKQVVLKLGVPEDNVRVNPWAPNSGCEKITDRGTIETIKRRYGLKTDQKYILGLGAADPRKNTLGIIKAWSMLSSEIREEYALLLVGIQESSLDYFREVVNEMGVGGSCHLHGFAPEEDMPGLVSEAEVMWYASLSEGFGLPILDAFACGTAVLTSNVSSMPEVAGEAAVVVNPRNYPEMAERLASLLKEESLRREYVRRGSERVQQFTWTACAQRVARIFEEIW